MLRLQDLKKKFGALVAVDGISFEVQKGEIFGLLGPNGAGKTTTVSMAVGLLAPDSGSVALDGHGDPIASETRRAIGIAPQTLAIYEELTGEENLMFLGRLQGLRGSALRERVDWCLNLVGLYDRRRDRAGTWSGGMQRRLNLAGALVHNPPLLFLDEPTVGVDPHSRNAILERIQGLRDAGHSVLYTTHYMEEAQRLCDRVGIIDKGRLLALDTVRALIQTHGGPNLVTVETTAGTQQLETEDPMAEFKRLHDAGNLLTFRVEEPNLEAVFLNLTGRSLRD